jgi:hypothetical protein
MTRKFLTVFVLLLFLLPVLSFAQSRALLFPDGDLKKIDRDEARKVRVEKDKVSTLKNNIVFSYINAQGTPDTLATRDIPGGAWNSNFGFEGQDWMCQWYVAPADLDVVAIGFAPSEPADGEDPNNLQVKLIKMAWSAEELAAITDDDRYLGWYEATGNGKYDKSALPSNPDVTGDWIDAGDEDALTSPFGEDIWSDYGVGAPKQVLDTDVGTSSNPNYLWVDMDLLGFRPSVLQGEVFGVILYNAGGTVGDVTRAGVWANADLGVGAFKFYSDGRNTTGADGDHGWWARTYSWDIVAAVDLTGDRAPKIEDYDILFTTLSTETRTVTAVISDDNPSGGPAGVDEAILHYSLDGGSNWVDVTMTGTEPNFSGDIPGQSPGTEILYYVSATDVEGLSVEAGQVFYSIFLPVEQTLWVHDYSVYTPDFIGAYYWLGTEWVYDTWDATYGSVTPDLLENYQVIYHVMGDGPDGSGLDIGELYNDWLDGATAEVPRRLFISGQDYGVISAFEDTTFSAGAFEYDYLGVETLGPQDINYDGTAESYQGAYAVDPVAESLSDTYAAFEGDSLQLYYWPYDELGWSNWIDNLTPLEGAVVDFTDPNQEDAVVGVHYSGENWKTVFWTIDPIALSFYDPADTSSSYYWGVYDVENLLIPVLEWFGDPVASIEEGGVITARTYELKQNYPNPFNPTTTIEYSIPNKAKVSLKVFDIQGREVVTLVNKNENAGKHTVNFDASKFATGVYFYQLTTNDNQALVKKMMFIK